MKTLAIIPVYNEADQVGSLIDRFPKGVCDLLIVDDASNDGCKELIAKRAPISIRHEQRTGVGKCLQDGFRHALASGYEAVIVMAGNGKDNPAEIPRLLDALEAGHEYIQGSRFLKGGEWNNLPPQRWFAIKGLTWVWQVLTFHRLSDVTNGFRAYRTSFLKHPQVQWDQEWLQTYELEYYLHYKALTLNGIRFMEIPVTKNYPKKTNYSKIRPGLDWWRIIRPIILLRLGFKK